MQNLLVRLALGCALIAVSCLARANAPLAVEKINQIASEIQRQYAPDKRTAIFQVTFSENPPAIEVESTDSAAIAELERQLGQENISIEVNSRLLPAKELNGKVYGVATLSVCNNRVAPANAAEMATQMLLGTPVEVLKKQRGYYLVRTPDKYIAWTDDDGISTMDAAAFQEWQRSEKVVFTVDYGHAWTKPSENSQRVSDLVNGNILQLLGQQRGFVQVRYPDGRIAYIPARQTTPYRLWLSRKKPEANEIINTAKTLLGVPYLWGGTSIKGVDCSGLTKTAFFLNGVILPRDASQQALIGEPIEITENGAVTIAKCLKNLVAGDLLFFGSARQPGEAPRISHTALYLGKGEFIQAAGQVRINSLLTNSPRYDDIRTKTLLSARRVLNSISAPEIVRVAHHPLYRNSVQP